MSRHDPIGQSTKFWPNSFAGGHLENTTIHSRRELLG